MTITCGIDWAEAHHDVAIMNNNGQVTARARINTGLAGSTELMTLLAEPVDDPSTVPVAIETDKDLIVVALQAAGIAVFAINPRAVARYRERHGQSGKKSDPGDAAVLADVLRHQPSPAPADARDQPERARGKGVGSSALSPDAPSGVDLINACGS